MRYIVLMPWAVSPDKPAAAAPETAQAAAATRRDDSLDSTPAATRPRAAARPPARDAASHGIIDS